MSFPFEIDQGIASEQVKEVTPPKEYEIDYNTGQLTGKVVEGLEAVKVWVYLAMNTDRYKHIIYSWGYGSELNDLIGQEITQEYIESEFVRMVSENLLQNEFITDVGNFEVKTTEDGFTGSFTVFTIFGEVSVNV